MCPCWLAELHSVVWEYIRHCHTHYTLLHYLSDLFKLFIILNYVYFAYMVYSKLWYMLNKCFETPQCPQYCEERRRPCVLLLPETKPCPRPCSQGEGIALACTCFKPPANPPTPKNSCGPKTCTSPAPKTSNSPAPKAAVSPRRSSSACNLGKKNVCSLYAKPNTSPGDEKKETASCASSVERIQVEFNCKPKKVRKMREGKIPKNCRSCTKCGKTLSATVSKCGMRNPLPNNVMLCSRKADYPKHVNN